MAGYTPLFNEIVTSSVWNESNPTRIVWITMLALADKEGVVNASASGLAPVARVTLEECEKAIDILSSPDKDSRSPEYEGRRIIKIDGGWQVINHKKYREKAKSRAEYMRQYRKKRNNNVTLCNNSLHDVTKRSPTNANANANATNNKKKNNKKKKHRFLDFVLLTDDEYKKLCEKFGSADKADKWIKILNDGIELKGYKYKSHYRAILNWYERDLERKKQDPKQGQYERLKAAGRI